MKQGKKYTKDLPRLLYTFYINSINNGEIPSISKFARHTAFTVEDLNSFRKHTEFDKAWKETNEIRRDYLTDSALTRRFDPSFVKFLLGIEFGVSDDINNNEDISVTIKVEE